MLKMDSRQWDLEPAIFGFPAAVTPYLCFFIRNASDSADSACYGQNQEKEVKKHFFTSTFLLH